jgi:hypothetical protein
MNKSVRVVNGPYSRRGALLAGIVAAFTAACDTGDLSDADAELVGTGGEGSESGGATSSGGSLDDQEGLAGSSSVGGGDVTGSSGGTSNGGGVASGGTAASHHATGGMSASHGEAGAPGSSDTNEFAWLESEGTECEDTDERASPLPTDESQDCAFLELVLPGVLEYEIDPAGFDLTREGAGGSYKYVGCDEVGEPCEGRLRYDWKVEYLADNEWYVEISPVHDECQYDHVLLHLLPSEELSPRATLTWTQTRLTLHLQPTERGLTVGAVRSEDDQLLQSDAFTEMAYNGGWAEPEIRSLFNEAFVEHLKSLEWTCSHP